jgi:cysteine-rich CPCC protein
MLPDNYPCPACGFLTADEPPGSYNICDVCGWEDDHVQLRFPYLQGGANKESLYEHQQAWIEKIPLAVQERDGFRRDVTWRPLREGECSTPSDAPRTGMEYFEAAGEDAPTYYWRESADTGS